MYSSRNVNIHFFDILYRLIPQNTYSGPIFYAILVKKRKFRISIFPPIPPLTSIPEQGVLLVYLRIPKTADISVQTHF